MWLPREDILHFEEIETLADVFLDPVSRKCGSPAANRSSAADCRTLSPGLAGRSRIRDLAMTTNGVLLSQHARGAARCRPASPHREPRHASGRSFS